MRICVTTVVMLALVAMAMPVSAEEVLELTAPVRGYDPTWPPDGSTWHWIYPADLYCSNGVQTGHTDADGDGMMSYCDEIFIDGVSKHIEWVGPTITLRAVEPGRQAVKYIEPIAGSRQYSYHEVSPTYCNIIQTATPIENVCQIVWIESPPEDVGEWHVEAIETNIRTNGMSPAEPSTWSRIKAFIGNLLD